MLNLAHAGGPDRRKQIEEGLVTADKISEAIRTLVHATQTASAYVLFAGGRLNGGRAVRSDRTSGSAGGAAGPRSRRCCVIWDAFSCERDAYAAGVEDELMVRESAAAA